MSIRYDGPSAIVFDLDGTLIDSALDLHHIANILLDEEGLSPVTLDEAKTFIGSGTPTFIRRMREARGIPDADQQRLLDGFMARYSGAVQFTQLYPGVVDALGMLEGQGHPMAICTNKPERPARAVLDHFDLARFFPTIIGGDTTSAHKPDPTPLRAAFAGLGTKGGLFVGDSEVDAQTAQNAEIPFLLFTEGYRKSGIENLPHQTAFTNFADLPTLIQQSD